MSALSAAAAPLALENLVAACAAQVPGLSLLVSPEDVKPYECDGLSCYRALPGAVLLPENEAETVAALRLCAAAGVPVVARGAGTGLSGGAMPVADGIVLSMAKLNRVLSIDPLSRTALVQPGVRNLAISEAVAYAGLYYAPDPSSQIACTIGGNVAENSGGVHCLKYGLTVHNVQASLASRPAAVKQQRCCKAGNRPISGLESYLHRGKVRLVHLRSRKFKFAV